MYFCVIGSVQVTHFNSTTRLHLTILHHDFGDNLSTNTLCISSHNPIIFIQDDMNAYYLKVQVLRDITPGHSVNTSHILRGQSAFILGSNNLLELLTQRKNVTYQRT